MNKKTMKRWFGRVAAVTAALTLGTSQLLAASEDLISQDPDAVGSLSVYKYDITAAESAGVTVSYAADGAKNQELEAKLAAYGLAGVEFTAIKVSDILTESNSGHIRLVYSVDQDVRTALDLKENNQGVYSGQELNTALAQLLEDHTAGKNTLESLMKNRTGTITMTTDQYGQAKASDLELGLYLVVETKVPANVYETTDPFLVSVPSTDAAGDQWFYDVTVYPKNQSNDPVIDKLVRNEGLFADTTTASGGDTVTYRIVAKVPEVTSTTSYLTAFDFKDTLPVGLEYGKDLKIAFYTSKTAAADTSGKAAASWRDEDKCFTTSVSGQSLTVTMTEKGLSQLNHTYKDQYMVLEYTAKVKASSKLVLGDNGNVNEAELTYKRTNQEHKVTIKDQAEVYAYGVELQVSYSDDNGSPKDMAFILQDESGKYLTVTEENGIYYMTGLADQEDKAGVMHPDTDGILRIYGLEEGTYEMTQTETGKGYSLMAKKAEISIEGTIAEIEPSQAPVTGKVNEHAEVTRTLITSASATVDTNAVPMLTVEASPNAVVPLEMINAKTSLLPKTGGEGMLMLVLLGAVILVIGMALSQRKRNEV